MKDRFQILSLDGGGLKGLYTAAILTHLEEGLGFNIVDHFDLITGTSTGGIIALGLASGLRPRQIVEFYVSKGPNIFPQNFFGWRQLFKNKYNSIPLSEALQDCFKDKILNDCDKRLVIPSYNLTNDSIYLFKTRHHDTLNHDFKLPIWQIAMATASAPTFFSSFRQINNLRLIDGGVWANNPSLVGIVEAIYLLNKSLDSIKLLSMGTTKEVIRRNQSLDNGGYWQWKQDAAAIIMRGQSIGVHKQVELLLPDRYLRIDSEVPFNEFKLDKLDVETILARASNDSRNFEKPVKDMFADYIAEKFTPLPMNESRMEIN